MPYEKLLKAFKRVKLKAGQKRTICFTLDKSAFSYLDLDMKKAYASGEYVISTKDCSTSVIV
ncbi:MAG: fibronectin type III-like domain-contianing protein [Christensenellaceae bacterium]